MSGRPITLDHVTVGVSDLERSRAFYEAALAPLGAGEPTRADWGADEYEFGSFAISTDYPTGAPVHIAFAAASREQVDAFHAAALAAGGRDNGAPGVRTEYAPDYYGAFVLDPDGHNVEAVHHG